MDVVFLPEAMEGGPALRQGAIERKCSRSPDRLPDGGMSF